MEYEIHIYLIFMQAVKFVNSSYAKEWKNRSNYLFLSLSKETERFIQRRMSFRKKTSSLD